MRDGPGKGEWGFEIVHRDLKPGNGKIFRVEYSNCAEVLNEQQFS